MPPRPQGEKRPATSGLPGLSIFPPYLLVEKIDMAHLITRYHSCRGYLAPDCPRTG
jgi:hypothetical protein